MVGLFNVKLSVSIVYVSGFVVSPSSSPPFSSYVIVYSIALQFAVYSLFPVDPPAIVTVSSGSSPFEPVHPVNVYPTFPGFVNVIVSSSIV